MAFSIRVWDASGRNILDVTPSLGRTLGVLQISSSGSYQDDRIGLGRVWTYMHLTNTDAAGYIPIISVSGTTINWSYPASTQYHNAEAMLFYGTY